jgi:hypothetical protein
MKKILFFGLILLAACKSVSTSKNTVQAPLPYAIYASSNIQPNHINDRHPCWLCERKVIALFPDSTYLFLWGSFGQSTWSVPLDGYGCLRGKFLKEDSSIFISKTELRLQTMEPRFENHTTHQFKIRALNPNINAFAIDRNELKIAKNYLEFSQLGSIYEHDEEICWDTFRLHLQGNLDVKGSILEKCECTNEPVYNQVYAVEQKDSTYSKTKVWISLPKDSKKEQLRKSRGETH